VGDKGSGMLEANEAGAFTRAQDEESCMVCGMLRKAMGPTCAVGYVLP
jgi:chemotaxis response regulator CheB